MVISWLPSIMDEGMAHILYYDLGLLHLECIETDLWILGWGTTVIAVLTIWTWSQAECLYSNKYQPFHASDLTKVLTYVAILSLAPYAVFEGPNCSIMYTVVWALWHLSECQIYPAIIVCWLDPFVPYDYVGVTGVPHFDWWVLVVLPWILEKCL